EDGVLIKVNQSNWATPVVAIFKPSGGVRLCGDYSVTLNPELVIDKHPLPTIDELFADMAGGQRFTKLDLSQAYLQLEVREEDRELLTLSTHLGLYTPTRLMYGVAPAVAIKWDNKCEKAWLKVREEMLSNKFLDHYNPNLELRLATDASPVGVGACLSQVYPDGIEKPLQYASRSLTKTQRNYTQMDREAYGIIF
uniref:Reverse transcriptase/retrotransposon-derived protein RNase H-like domain-containing protein n=1 Tax=Phlebotomus papatasi TaxID=29031 RepID=A0A1B0DIN9_PHLPP